MVPLLLVPVGLALGFAIGRWWAVVLGAAAGIAVGLALDADTSALVAVVGATSGALGAAAGVGVRQWLRHVPRRAGPPENRPVKGEPTRTAAGRPQTQPEHPEPGRPVRR